MSKEFMNEATLKRLIEKIKSEFSKYIKAESLTVSATQGNDAGVSVAILDTGIDLQFVIPKGEKGDPGEQGPKGDTGEKGDPGNNGVDGYTPIRGTDYWTEADKAEIKGYVDEAILGGAW